MVIKKLDINTWLDEYENPCMPYYTREAIKNELKGRLGTLWSETETDFEKWCVKYIAKNWDLVLDLLTMMAMESRYGRNQEEKIATHLAVKCIAEGSLYADGGFDVSPDTLYHEFDALLSRCRTNVLPREVCP